MVRVSSIICRGRPPGSSSEALQLELPCLQPYQHRDLSQQMLVTRRIASSWIWIYPRWLHVLKYPRAAFATFYSAPQLLWAFPLLDWIPTGSSDAIPFLPLAPSLHVSIASLLCPGLALSSLRFPASSCGTRLRFWASTLSSCSPS